MQNKILRENICPRCNKEVETKRYFVKTLDIFAIYASNLGFKLHLQNQRNFTVHNLYQNLSLNSKKDDLDYNLDLVSSIA